jgi:DNA (cytosine-5)-methyltransferase 1
MKPLLLDLFSGAGGAGYGYSLAGFDVVGVDINPQPRYPFEFHQADALEYLAAHGHEFDFIHASPPCQAYSVLRFSAENYPELIVPVREMLKKLGRPYCIENVSGAKGELENPLMLCGTMFGLRVIRHRLFECNPPIYFAPAPCNHHMPVVKKGKWADPEKHFAAIHGHFSNQEYAKKAMGIDWMSRDELAESIPPAYTQYIGLKARACLTKHAPDKWESAPSTGIVPPLSLSTSQSESTPPTCG